MRLNNAMLATRKVARKGLRAFLFTVPALFKMNIFFLVVILIFDEKPTR